MAGWFWRLAAATPLLGWATALATPLPDEWPGEWPGLPPRPAELPAPALRPSRPELVPAEVAVGDIAPPRLLAAAGRASAEAWLHPLPMQALEQSPWGWRWSAARGTWRMHTGVDLIVPAGTPVLAARSGRVVLAEWVSGYGLTVLLDHGDGWQTLYAHLASLAVAAEQPLGRGQLLGRVGATGSASTPHLHLELRRRGERGVQAVNPAVLLQAPKAAEPVLAAGSQP
jgi:murein DD-endopeptidase MepM/ murein hydrolase activator NlpD